MSAVFFIRHIVNAEIDAQSLPWAIFRFPLGEDIE